MTQDEIGRLCNPPVDQAAVSQFENGEARLTWPRAKQLAPAYCPALTGRAAVLGVFGLWFRTVQAFGDEAMKREAREIEAHMGGEWSMPTAGLLQAEGQRTEDRGQRLARLAEKVNQMISEQEAERSAAG